MSSRAPRMEGLPAEICLKIFQFFDHQTLATAPQVCREWRLLASDETLWCNLFLERWGSDCATFYAPHNSKAWKDVYIIQDRCDRYGLGLKIIREGSDYYLIHQGEVQRCLGQGRHRKGIYGDESMNQQNADHEEHPRTAISDSILFFIGDLEAACAAAKRTRV